MFLSMVNISFNEKKIVLTTMLIINFTILLVLLHHRHCA